jgi:tight adherence protein C
MRITGALRSAPPARFGGAALPVRLLAALAARLVAAARMRHYRTTLLTLGYGTGSALAWVLAAKLLLAPVGFVLGSQAGRLAAPLFGDGMAIALPVVGTLGAFLLPDRWLKGKMTRHRRDVLRSLPDALDLLTISLTAGLGFHAALTEVVRRFDNACARELNTVLREIAYGRTRRDALSDFATRLEVDEVSTFVVAVLQAEELGSPLKETLRQQSELQREHRRRRAEEHARRASVLMLLPMLVFIFPALLILGK